MTRKGDRNLGDSIGVDISKNTLDAQRLSDGSSVQFTNGPAGWKAFKEWFETSPDAAITFVPAGSYSCGFEREMLASGLSLSRVNPLHARRFGEATGKLAKTDRVDAKILAEMGVAVKGRIVESTDLTIG